MDNADDPSLEIPRFLLRCTHGHVIITTRNQHRKTIAPKSTHHVDLLPFEESMKLLLRSSGYEDNAANRQLAEDVVRELGFLPLALAHAGAYILKRQCLYSYLKTFRTSRAELLKRKFELAHDYTHSVAATIGMSFDKLSSKAVDLIGILSHFGTSSVPLSIIERAATAQFRHVAIDTKQPLHDETVKYAKTLMNIVCPEGAWSSFVFDNMIEECEKYSPLRLFTLDGEKFYSIHVLVQNFVQSACIIVHGEPPIRLVTRLLGSAITYGAPYEHIAFNRLMAPHLQLINLDDVREAGDHFGFGYVLEEMGGARLASCHLKQCMDIWQSSGSGFTLIAMEYLSHSYITTGKEQEGFQLKLKKAKMLSEFLGKEDPTALNTMHYLALSYSYLGKHQDAALLQGQLLERCKVDLGEEHSDTVSTMQNLANSYSELGRHEEALYLNKDVLEKWRNVYGEEHPFTLAAMSNLATSYAILKRHEEALPLQERVLEKWRQVLGEEHFKTLKAMDHLATTYTSLGRDEEGCPLREAVLQKRIRLFGEENADTLRIMSDLALSYQRRGRDNDAVLLLEKVLEKQKKRLGEDHAEIQHQSIILSVLHTRLGREEEAQRIISHRGASE